MASQIEIDGQDDGEDYDGPQDEDQDTVLDNPSQHASKNARALAQVGVCLTEPFSGFLDFLSISTEV